MSDNERKPITVTHEQASVMVKRGECAWWDEAHTLVLIRPRALAKMPPGARLRCINGDAMPLEDVDEDTRGGFLAFGYDVAPPEAREATHGDG